MIKKILWVFKRHPFLYLARFKLLSKNSNIQDIDQLTYNSINIKKDIPAYFHEINAKIFDSDKPTTDFELVKKLSLWLDDNIKGGPGLSEASDKSLKTMLEGKGGVCSDITQVFNNFCVLNDIKVREWGSTRIPFNKNYGGHSFNEIYCNELNKWLLIDVSSCVFFYFNDDLPLSVIELYQLIRDNKEVSFKSFNKIKIIDKNNIIKNYLNSDNVPFLICNYSNKTYDRYLNLTRPLIPVFITHFVLYSLRKSYHYKFPLDDYKKIFS